MALIMNEEEFLNDVLLGQQDAVLFCRLLGNISQTWDDMIDKDKHVSDNRINAAFNSAILRLPVMPFYIDNISDLYPIIRVAIIDWMTSNELEKGSKHDKTLSFVLRDSFINIVIECSRIIGGFDYAVEVAPKIRRYFHDETLEDYLGGLS